MHGLSYINYICIFKKTSHIFCKRGFFMILISKKRLIFVAMVVVLSIFSFSFVRQIDR